MKREIEFDPSTGGIIVREIYKRSEISILKEALTIHSDPRNMIIRTVE